jgi:hypothetical protein
MTGGAILPAAFDAIEEPMRVYIFLCVLASGTALAHPGPAHSVRADASAPERQALTSRGNSGTQKNAGTADTQRGANGFSQSGYDKPTHDQQRFCVRNYLGKVNCIPFPNTGGH